MVTGRPTDMPRLTPKGDRTRRRVVEAAATLMFDRGVAGTTIEDVKAEAGVSSSQLYHYFADKHALVRAVVAFQTETVVGGQEELFASLDSLRGLRAWRDAVVDVQRRLDCHGGCPVGSLGSELAEADPDARAEIAAGFERWEVAIGDGLRAMADRGELAPDASPGDLAVATLAALQGGLLLAQVHRSTRPLESSLDAMIELITTHTRAPAGR